MSKAKKQAQPSDDKAARRTGAAVPVRCRECSHAGDFIGNSCFCTAQNHRVCACDRYGRMCQCYNHK